MRKFALFVCCAFIATFTFGQAAADQQNANVPSILVTNSALEHATQTISDETRIQATDYEATGILKGGAENKFISVANQNAPEDTCGNYQADKDANLTDFKTATSSSGNVEDDNTRLNVGMIA
jgi:hypothetical protein